MLTLEGLFLDRYYFHKQNISEFAAKVTKPP